MRYRSGALIAVALIGVLVGCSSQSGGTPSSQASPGASNEQITMKMNIGKAVAYGGLIVAREKGFFKQAGINYVSAGSIMAGTDQMAAMLGGSFAFTGTGSAGWYAALSRGVPVTAVAIYAGGGDRIALVAKKGVNIKSAKDLAGKNVGSAQRNVSQEALYAYLFKGGVDPKSVNIVNVTDDSVPAALASGSLDAGTTFEPYVTGMVAGNIGTVVTRMSEYLGGAYTVIVFPTEFVKKNPEALRRFTTALSGAMQYIRQNPADASKVLGTMLTNSKPDDLKATLKYLQWDPRFTPEAVDSLQKEMDLQQKLGWIEKPFDMKSIIDPSFMEAVEKEHPEYFTDLK